MKITIDTNSDSKNEIKETIRLLKSLLEREDYSEDSSNKGDFDLPSGNLDFMNSPEEPEKDEKEYKTIILD